MAPLSRRGFLGKGSMTMAAAGLMASAPAGAIGALLGSGGAPALEDGTTDLSELGSAVDGPVVAHIRDLGAGEISVFAGEREVVIRDAAVAARLLRALK